MSFPQLLQVVLCVVAAMAAETEAATNSQHTPLASYLRRSESDVSTKNQADLQQYFLSAMNDFYHPNEAPDAPRTTSQKRALSVLTRWRSFGGQWGQSSPPRKMPRAPMAFSNSISGSGTKDMPLRRVGGPLRWGR